jgi:alpha-L-fucosidase
MLIRSLVEVASRGGNFLLNAGPQPDGVIQPEFQERLRTIGGQSLKMQKSEGKLRIELPSQLPDPDVSAISLRV